MNRTLRFAGTIAAMLVSVATASAQLTLAARADNDLVLLLPDAKRFDTPTDAINSAPDGSGVLILADGYPKTRTPVASDLFELAKAKNLRLYVEYPAAVSGLKLSEARQAVWERGVVTSDAFGEPLPKLRIVAPHDCHWIPVDPLPRTVHLAIARVAGFDTAVFGLAKEHAPLLFETNDGHLIATTKLSGFVTTRFAPSGDWKVIWKSILQKIDPKHAPPTLDIKPTVRPALGATDPLPTNFEQDVFDRAARFYLNSRLIIPRDRKPEIAELLTTGTEETEPPKGAAPGDGSLGMLEGYASRIRFDGSQTQRTPIRADCNAEAAMVLAMTKDDRSRQIATNLLDYVFGPEMQSMGRLDPKHPAFGLIAWGAISPAWQVANYGDDNARAILAAILASASLNSDRWDTHLTRALLANLRTTGSKGFRGDRIDIAQLQQLGWKHFHDAPTVNIAPHFESGLWACYLWAYARTGEPEFLDKTTTAIRITMDAYAQKQWRWMDSVERSRMLLCLSWLVRVQDTPEHRAWVTAVAHDLLQAQQPCGAIQERIAGAGGGHYQIPPSNEAYGTSETPLIQTNGDPASDQLYTTGFALFALHEANAFMNDAKLQQAEDKLAEFLCRIQVRSEKAPYLDGAWFRAFDYQRWDYWSSSADLGWGVWSVEAGWGQAWIAATLKLRESRTTMWDLTANSTIKNHLPAVREEMTRNTGGPWKP